MLTNFVGVLLAIGSYFNIKNIDRFELLNTFVSKGYIIYLLTWLTLFSVYIFVISIKDGKDKKSEVNKIINLFGILYLIFLIIIIIKPLYYHNINGAIYSYGPSANVMYIVSIVYITVWLIRLSTNIKRIRDKKYLPIFAFMGLGLVVMIIQKQHPELLLMTSMETFIVFLMYHTIENPDMQIIEEVHRAKEKNVMCENCELYQEVKITKNADRKPQIDNSNLLASMTEEGPAEDISLGDAEDNYFDFGVSYEPPKKEEPKTVDITDEVKIVDHNEEESKAEKIEVKEKPETRQTIKAKENKQKLEDKDFLEDTKEFESLTHDEEDINEILKGTEDITQTDDSNDIFNLIDSMYDEEEDKK